MNFLFILWVLIALLAGIGLGFYLARHFMKKELIKNPPLNEAVVKEMMTQMGRKPSQKQINAVMKTINEQNNQEK